MLGPSSAIWMGLFCKEVKPGQQREDENEMTRRMHPSCTVGRAGRGAGRVIVAAVASAYDVTVQVITA